VVLVRWDHPRLLAAADHQIARRNITIIPPEKIRWLTENLRSGPLGANASQPIQSEHGLSGNQTGSGEHSPLIHTCHLGLVESTRLANQSPSERKLRDEDGEGVSMQIHADCNQHRAAHLHLIIAIPKKMPTTTSGQGISPPTIPMAKVAIIQPVARRVDDRRIRSAGFDIASCSSISASTLQTCYDHRDHSAAEFGEGVPRG